MHCSEYYIPSRPCTFRTRGSTRPPTMIDFFELSNEMLCMADRRGHFVRVNSAWTKSFGWTAEELTTRPYLEFVHPDDYEATIREATLLESDAHETIRFENRYRCRDGSYRWLSWQVAPEAETGLLVCVARDVTEQKQQTEALRQAEERFRMLAAQAPVGIAQADVNASIYFVNPRWCELAGVAPQNALGYAWKEIIHPDDLQAEMERLQTALQTKQDVPVHEFRFQHASGEIRWGLSSISLVKDQRGEPVSLIATVEDVTELKKAELALRESEVRFRAFMDNTPAIAWAKDEAGRIVYLNRASQEHFGLKPETAYGKTDFDYWPPETARRLQANDRIVLDTGKPLKIFEETGSAEKPTDYWITYLFPYEDRGTKLVGGIATDITELKRAEQVLKTKQDLLRNLIAVQEKERQYVSYEFHDGLIQYATAALMFLESHRRKFPTADNDFIERAVKSLRTGIDDGRRVIRGIRPTVLDDSGVKAAIEDLIDQFSSTEIQVGWTCDPEIGRMPAAVEAAMYRVAQEALTNAKKYSGSKSVCVALQRRDGRVRLEIRDFGIGFNVAEARSRGFGLLGMAERVRLLDGEYVLDSRPGQGTRIVATIPLDATEDEATSA
jgi:PAS domain S-box-containing protein